jgi:hypothetical protein
LVHEIPPAFKITTNREHTQGGKIQAGDIG